MSKRVSCLLAATALLSACQMPADVPGAKPHVATRRPAPSPTPSADEPDPKELANASGEARALDLLQEPATPTQALTGTVSIDAHYLLSQGLGKLIGQSGGNLIGQSGGNVIAAGGGNLIGQAGGTLIGQAGGTLIGQSGGNLIGQSGGNLIGKRKFSLLAETDLALGTVLPAAEMELAVLDMTTGQPLPLGVDDEGREVLSIYSNLTSDFKIFLPEGVHGDNVLIEATVPNSSDMRLAYHFVAPLAADEATIDEDTALVSAYFREAFVSRLERLFMQATGDRYAPDGWSGEVIDPQGFGDLLPTALRPVAQPIADRMTEAVVSANVGQLSDAARKERARRTADALLAFVDLQSLKMKDGSPVIGTMVEILRDFRERATEKMKADPGYFATQDYLVEANARRTKAGLAPFEILKPSDLGTYALEDVLASPVRRYVSETLVKIFESVGAPIENKDRLNEAMNALLVKISLVMITNQPDASGLKPMDAAVAAIKDER